MLLLYRSLELLVQKYCITSLLLFWCPYMVTNVSVQCNGGLLPDIIPLTLCDSIGEPFSYHVEFCPFSQCSHLNFLTNDPRSSETYQRQDDVLGPELQRKPSAMICCPAHLPNKVIKSDSKTFLNYRKVTRRQIMRHFQGMAPTFKKCQNGSSNLLCPYREQPRLTWTLVAYPRPALSATKRTNHAIISIERNLD